MRQVGLISATPSGSVFFPESLRARRALAHFPNEQRLPVIEPSNELMDTNVDNNLALQKSSLKQVIKNRTLF